MTGSPIILEPALSLSKGGAKDLVLHEEIRGNDGGTEDMGVVPPDIVVGTGIGIPVSGNIGIAIRGHEERIEVCIRCEHQLIQQLPILMHLEPARYIIVFNIIIHNSVNIIPSYAYLTRNSTSSAQMLAKLVLSLPVLISGEYVFA